MDVLLAGAAPRDRAPRIAHVSDFHFRGWTNVLQAARERLLGLDYDLVVATGDFGTSPSAWDRAAKLLRKFFEPLADRSPIYAVLGNHDHPGLATAPDLPLVFLNDEAVSIECAGASVELIGVDQSLPRKDDLEAALGTGKQSHDFSILLAHYPSTVFRVPDGRIDLQLSGHTHGGQIRFPWVGCLWSNDEIGRRMARGLHTVSGVKLHISPGLGVSMPLPFRINCPPEVTLLSLKGVKGSPGHHSGSQLAAPVVR